MEEFLEHEYSTTSVPKSNLSSSDYMREVITEEDKSKSSHTSQMRDNIDNFIAECDRYNISDRAAASLATGLLRDFGYVTDIVRSMVIDRFSFRRRRLKRRAEAKLKREEQGIGQIKCLGFDGKRDKGTKVIRDIVMNGKIATRYITILQANT